MARSNIRRHFTLSAPSGSAKPASITARRRGSLTAALSLAVSLAATAGCGKNDDADDFRAGVPAREDVAMVVPGGNAAEGALTAAATTSETGVTKVAAALLGEKAELYELTRGITVMVNGATRAVLTLVKTITDFPPTSVTADAAVWGPHTESPLAPQTWRLTVTRNTPGVFHYVLEAKPRAAADDRYLAILTGDHTVTQPGAARRRGLPSYGSGSFVLDWDKAQMLPEHDANVGRVNIVYSRLSPTSDVNIGATFTQVKDEETGALVDAEYDYVDHPAQGGNFQFTLAKNSIVTTAARETLTVRSRWQESGAGRADVKLLGGDLGATEATANECWNDGDLGFVSTYFTNSYGDAAKMWGSPTACVFATPDYAMF